jgi:DNA-binding PadR family transcriptional regulator
MERELLLLGLLRQGEMHGYQLHDFIEKNLAFCTDLKKATAYVLLDKMLADGWVQAKEAREGNRPQRRVYSLTRGGEEAFERMLRENLATFSAAKTGSDIGLAFVDALPPGEALQRLEQRHEAIAKQLAEFEGAPQHAGSYQLLIDHQAHYLRSERDWLDQVIARLRAQPQ